MRAVPQNLTLAQQLSGAFSTFGAIVAAAFIALALGYAARGLWLTPEFERSRVAVKAEAAAHTAMVDQESGLRGYLLTHDVEFLAPYTRARQALKQANLALTQNVGSSVALVAPILSTRLAEEMFVEHWGNAVIDTRPAADPPSLGAGKALFDAYRRQYAVLENALERHRASLESREHHLVTAQVVLVLMVFSAVFLLAIRQHLALRDSIVAPVAVLLEHIREVSDGHLDTSVHPVGPLELRQLGDGLNEMVRSLAAAREVAAFREAAVREHSLRLRRILDATREFSDSLKLEYVVAAVKRSVAAVGGYERITMWLMNDEEKQLVDYNTAADGPPAAAPLGAGHGLAERAARSGRITFEDPTGQVRFIDSTTGSMRALAIPLIVGARVVGALEARHCEAKVAMREEIEVLEMLATHAATAIESARLHEILERRTQIDPLTQLFNRRRLEQDLETECQRCTRYGRPLAFVMLDIDHFKALNDTYGHPKADIALQQLAAVVASCLRTTDTAYRYGGEEFCVLMRETSAEDAMHFAERTRQRIEQRFASGELTGITASLGVAGFSSETPLPASLIDAADAALYESKRAGRNRVILSTRPRHSSIPARVLRITSAPARS